MKEWHKQGRPTAKQAKKTPKTIKSAKVSAKSIARKDAQGKRQSRVAEKTQARKGAVKKTAIKKKTKDPQPAVAQVEKPVEQPKPAHEATPRRSYTHTRGM